MSKLYLIESPFQFLSALEAKYKFGEGKFLIRYSGKKENDRQLKNMIQFFDIKNLQEIKINVDKKIYDFIKLFYFRFKSFKENKFFVGNLESGFFNLLLKKVNKNNIILMDDGAKTIYIQNFFNEHYFYHLFTMFNLKPLRKQFVYINNFEYLKSQLKDLNYSNEVIFVGSKLSELNIVSEREYLDVLLILLNKYKNLVYIPHREESLEKLKKISNMGIKIEKTDLPIELIGIKKVPKKVISFYSTALISLKRIYEIESNFIKLNLNNKVLEKIYSYYQTELKEEKI